MGSRPRIRVEGVDARLLASSTQRFGRTRCIRSSDVDDRHSRYESHTLDARRCGLCNAHADHAFRPRRPPGKADANSGSIRGDEEAPEARVPATSSVVLELEGASLSTHRTVARVGALLAGAMFLFAACSSSGGSAAPSAAAGGGGMDALDRGRQGRRRAHDDRPAARWCNYGELIDGFTAKYGIPINELNPDGGSGDEIEAIKANKDNKGPQAPDVIDVGLSFGPTGQDRRPDPAVQGLDLGLHPGHGQGCRRLLVRRLLRRPGLRGQHRGRQERPEGLGRPAQARVQEPGRPRRRPDRLEPGHLRRLGRGLRQRRLARQRPAGPRLLQEAQRRRQLRADHRQDRRRSPPARRRSASRGPTTPSPTRTRSPATRRSRSSSRRPAGSAACTSRRSAPTRRTRTRPSCGWSTSTPTRARTSG